MLCLLQGDCCEVRALYFCHISGVHSDCRPTLKGTCHNIPAVGCLQLLQTSFLRWLATCIQIYFRIIMVAFRPQAVKTSKTTTQAGVQQVMALIIPFTKHSFKSFDRKMFWEPLMAKHLLFKSISPLYH